MDIDASIPSSAYQILAGAIRNMLSIFPKKLGEPKVGNLDLRKALSDDQT